MPARMETYRAGNMNPPLPPLTARHIFDWLMEVGPTDASAMGQSPISWTTIRNWAAGTFQDLSAWEARMLRRLSVEYLSELQAAEDHNRPAPWATPRTEVDRAAEERGLRAVLG